MNNVGRFQFSLGGMMVFTAAVAVGLWVYLQVVANAAKLNLTANEWWGIGSLASIGFVVMLAVLFARR
jgi:hypothetical protein